MFWLQVDVILLPSISMQKPPKLTDTHTPNANEINTKLFISSTS